ncbi:ABC transporter permease [Chitinophaga parva]|uniref:ABC transporter permease n=1 Tax=Chitinophaga parva TaxID=2169414 RepID=A0A2T7BMA4_9BACT|nr:ABC transporter permease [Chitinophaga parva]PUZ28802.1 ABC transporter permease [Chitinophaga parva]
MFKNYIKIAWRSFRNSKVYSVINVLGLAMGLCMALLTGLWMWDECSFNRNFAHYDRLLKVYHNSTDNGTVSTYQTVPYPLAAEMRVKYAGDYKAVALGKGADHVMEAGETQLTTFGLYAETPLVSMLNMQLLQGSAASMDDVGSLLISTSLAHQLFGDKNPLDQVVRVDNKRSMKITGVFADFPLNCSFAPVKYLMPWMNIAQDRDWARHDIENNRWSNNSYDIYAQLQDHVSLENASAHIAGVFDHRNLGGDPKPVLQPMRNWHLYNNFKNGKPDGGLIQYVWLFGAIGGFVLLLACINFMNLSTARSEKRAREVGIRKSSGSLRGQLIAQFLVESVMMAAAAMVLALLATAAALPAFNQLADKQMHLPVGSVVFWAVILVCVLFTGIIAGSYPAFYLSAFKPVKVLKGTFKTGRMAALPRRLLVVVQFFISVVLVIGTVSIYQQIRYTQNRPVGYNREGLLQVALNTPEIRTNYEGLRRDLLQSGMVAEMAESSGPATAIWANLGGFSWEGMPADMRPQFGVTRVTVDYGKAVGWQISRGRDLSRDYGTDDHAVILNEAAVRYTGIKDPVGKMIRWGDDQLHVVGVVKDVVMESPFAKVNPMIFVPDGVDIAMAIVRLQPGRQPAAALPVIEKIFRQHNPKGPFVYGFVDDVYAAKFQVEERTGTLAAVFTVFAVLISCLGLFGLASFVAAQRTREIGIRKVLGATIVQVWGLLSRDFVMLVLLASVLAIPVAYYCMEQWLSKYEYHMQISWAVLLLSSLGALMLTLLTVSFQAIRAAMVNPVQSLRSE